MHFDPYTGADLPDCLTVFDSNVPKYFLATEREDFASFLASPHGTYLVMRDGDRVLGCGGVATKDEAAILCWGMIHCDFHRKGLGRALLHERLRAARTLYPGIRIARIETSQHSAGFFAKAGFRVDETRSDGFGPGLDLVLMALPLDE